MQKWFITIAILIVAIASGTAQVEVGQSPANETPTLFDVDAISFASDTSKFSRLTILAAIPYEQLSFVKQDDQFVARYEITASAIDSTNTLATEKLWTREIKVATFEQSVSTSGYSIEQFAFGLLPGTYQIAVLCRDLESRVTRRVAKKMMVFDYARPGLTLSDIMIVSKLVTKGEKHSMTPSISSNVGGINGPFHIFFEAYNGLSTLDSTKFVLSVFDMKNTSVLEADTVVKLSKGKNQLFLAIDHSSLPMGEYKLYVQAQSGNSKSVDSSLAITSRLFQVRWEGMPKSVKDLDLSIDQLTYIAKDKELEYIRAAKTGEEKQKRFFEFWKTKDPNPNTTRNEKMEEYYGRIDYANKHFKHYSEGWRTDMGMVYVIFGSPNSVDRHPFDSDAKPYEVWSYYELNHSFVFVDQTGFGDYRLTTPIWDVWQRPRN
jgi:GWxTD domain-containing protein